MFFMYLKNIYTYYYNVNNVQKNQEKIIMFRADGGFIWSKIKKENMYE